MMQRGFGIIALGGVALALAGCVSKERVTLLSPATQGDPIGGVVIEYDDRVAYLGDTSQQAKLRGSKVPYLVRQFDPADPFYSELASALPPMAVREYFYFALGEDTLAPEELDRLQAWLAENIKDRPGLHIEIAAHTDVSGGEALNDELSMKRAAAVRAQVKERIQSGQLDVSDDDIDELSGSLHWAQSIIDSGQNYVARDFRVAVVTIR